jgi:ABC-type uncharacterized transport system substrate-binding protein
MIFLRVEGYMAFGRREFLAGLGGVAAWSAAASAQSIKRLGVLMNGIPTDAVGQTQLMTFVDGLRKLGWADGKNMQVEVRWSAGDVTRMEAYATDLLGLFRPDVLLVASTANLMALKRVTSTTPIVFTGVSDPVEQGLVPNLTHPGGNITGFAASEFSIAGKWADLLKQMVPSIEDVSVEVIKAAFDHW